MSISYYRNRLHVRSTQFLLVLEGNLQRRNDLCQPNERALKGTSEIPSRFCIGALAFVLNFFDDSSFSMTAR